jgi:hypothetical protein
MTELLPKVTPAAKPVQLIFTIPGVLIPSTSILLNNPFGVALIKVMTDVLKSSQSEMAPISLKFVTVTGMVIVAANGGFVMDVAVVTGAFCDLVTRGSIENKRNADKTVNFLMEFDFLGTTGKFKKFNKI